MSLVYRDTLVPDCPWSRMQRERRSTLVWTLWAVTWVGLIAGYFNTRWWGWVVGFSTAHAIFVLGMVRFRPLVFPAQLRLAYAACVALGTYVPHMTWIMHLTTLGLAANLTVDWCPLSRLLYLLPWNREEPFDAGLPVRVFFSKPMPGRFRAPPPRRPLTDH